MTVMRWAGFTAVLGACGVGCGGSVAGPPPADNTTSGNSGSASPTGSSMQAGDGMNVPPPSDSEIASNVTLTMTDFTVPAGGEVYKCQDFANPFQGQQVDIKTYQLVMNQGSHHMILFYLPGAADGPLVDCPEGGLKQGPFTFASQSERATQTYPAGVGAAIPGDMGFTMNAHYVNANSSPIPAAVAVTMQVAVPGAVTLHAGGLQYILFNISIPPTGQPVTVTGSCSLSQDINLLWTSSHMHRRATHFVSTSGNTKLYETDQWADPTSAQFAPPLTLKAGADINWSCTYVNDTGSTLSFGPSASTNAMCNTNGAFYPVQDIRSPLISCIN
jgi:hypothetical protein